MALISLRAAANVQRDIFSRVTVLPFALGNATGQSEITASADNAGDARIGSRSAFSASNRGTLGKGGGTPGQSFAIQLTTLDRAISFSRPVDGGAIRLMKLDAQGFECNVLDGMAGLIRRGEVRALRTEVSRPHLRAQGCSEAGLLARLGAGWRNVREHKKGLGKHKKRLMTQKGMYEVEAWGPIDSHK